MRCVTLCLCIVYMNITARVKGQRQTFALPLPAGMRRQPFPPLPGFPLSPPPPLNGPAQPPPATLPSAVCFNAHGLFINALADFLRSLSFQVVKPRPHSWKLHSFSSRSEEKSPSRLFISRNSKCFLVPRLSPGCFFFF